MKYKCLLYFISCTQSGNGFKQNYITCFLLNYACIYPKKSTSKFKKAISETLLRAHTEKYKENMVLVDLPNFFAFQIKYFC